MKKTLSLFLILLTLLSGLASCSDRTVDENVGETDPNADPSAGSAEAEEISEDEEKLPLELAEGLDYDGYTVRILTPTAESGDSFITEVNGDLVNDALFNRDRTVEQLLNVTLQPISYAMGPDVGALQTSVTAGDDAYDFMHLGASTYFANRPTYERILLDVSDSGNIHIDSPWWNTDSIRELSYNGKSVRYLIGDISLSSISGASVIFYNKNLFGDLYHEPEKPYEDVLDGSWTIDKYSEYCSGAYTDVNGDGSRDIDDFYGTMTNGWMIVSLYNGYTDIHFYSRDENGQVVLDLDTDRVMTFAEKEWSLFYNNNGVFYNDQFEHGRAIEFFSRGSTLFTAWFLNGVEMPEMREMDDDYGILPFFKLDESQEEYRSDLNPSGTKWICIPITNQNVDCTTAVIEALSYTGFYDVTPTYYEQALKMKYTRDVQSGMVIDIVRDSIHSDYLIGIYRSTIGQHFVNQVRDGNQEFMSSWQKSEKQYLKTMDRAYADLNG